MSTNITDKISKLLRLADQRDSAEEAAVAYAQAQRLAVLHGLNLDDVLLSETTQSDDPPLVVADVEETVLEWWGKTVAWRYGLAATIAKCFSCDCYSQTDRLVVFGQPADMHNVTVLYRRIAAAIDNLAREAVKHYHGRESSRVYGRSFRLGAVSTIGKKLASASDVVDERRAEVDEQRRLAVAADDMGKLAASTTALARVHAASEHLDRVKAAVDAYGRDVLKLRKGRDFAACTSNGYYDGRQAARGIDTAKPARALT